MSLAMSRAEREAFLADTHVAIISVADGGRGPLTVPIWYAYEPGGEVRFVTAAASAKMARIRAAGRLSLCVQTETAPYRYVSVEGPVTVGAPNFEQDIRQLAHRYLGREMGETYLQMTADERAHSPAVLVRLRPERWLSVDYGKMVAAGA